MKDGSSCGFIFPRICVFIWTCVRPPDQNKNGRARKSANSTRVFLKNISANSGSSQDSKKIFYRYAPPLPSGRSLHFFRKLPLRFEIPFPYFSLNRAIKCNLKFSQFSTAYSIQNYREFLRILSVIWRSGGLFWIFSDIHKTFLIHWNKTREILVGLTLITYIAKHISSREPGAKKNSLAENIQRDTVLT